MEVPIIITIIKKNTFSPAMNKYNKNYKRYDKIDKDDT
jgi:hypothetical protein